MKAQGTIIPTMFIGLGGTGSAIVDRIAGKAKALPYWEERRKSLTSFVAVDTNIFDQHKLVHIPKLYRINIAAFNKAKAVENYREAGDPQSASWLDPGYEPRKGTKPGAGQIRVESRLGFFYHSPKIRQGLMSIVESALKPNPWRIDANVAKYYYVYLYGSLAGGTGSGSLLSMAYLVTDVIRSYGYEPRLVANLALSSLLEAVVESRLHGNIHANTYAALKEVEHMNKLSYPEVKARGRESEPFAYWRDIHQPDRVPEVSDRPFHIALLYDLPSHVTLDDYRAAIADDGYLQVLHSPTPLLGEVFGELDNYEQHQTALTKFAGAERNVGTGYSKNFGAVGAAVMRLPAASFLEYCARRFAAEALRSQITFGVSKTDSSDERARALADLAVDYDSKKFARMNEAARFDLINRSFEESVRELHRQDERDELLDGVWYQVVETVDSGKLIELDDEGEEKREETLTDRVLRELAEQRQKVMDRIDIRERPFIFTPENVNQYSEAVSKTKSDALAARVELTRARAGLEQAAKKGEPIRVLNLSPIHERYLVLRLLHLVGTKILPDAERTAASAGERSILNPKVASVFEQSRLEDLSAAAKSKRFGVFQDLEGFESVRDSIRDEFRGVVRATKRALDAEVALAQLRSLQTYLSERATSFARLSARMDSLVQDLETEALQLLRREVGSEDTYALQIEVLETLSEPKTRLWDQAFERLFVKGSKRLATFDRTTLAKAVAAELAPKIGDDGRVRTKTVEEMAGDLRNAMVMLGRSRLQGDIFGDGDSPGLDLPAALELEARIQLERSEGPRLSEKDVLAYTRRKIAALSQLSGVHARLNTAGNDARKDGVVASLKRRVVVLGDGQEVHPRMGALTGVLMEGLAGRLAVEKAPILSDPHMVIVHDAELGVPAYYFPAVMGDVESAYLSALKDESRVFDLHTNFQWEHSLENLNPDKVKISVGWSVRALIQGLVTGVIRQEVGDDGEVYLWSVPGRELCLGDSLASTLYRLTSHIHRREELVNQFIEQVNAVVEERGATAIAADRARLAASLKDHLTRLSADQAFGGSRKDYLDLPLFRTLAEVAAQSSSRLEASGPKKKSSGFTWQAG